MFSILFVLIIILLNRILSLILVMPFLVYFLSKMRAVIDYINDGFIYLS